MCKADTLLELTFAQHVVFFFFSVILASIYPASLWLTLIQQICALFFRKLSVLIIPLFLTSTFSVDSKVLVSLVMSLGTITKLSSILFNF